MEKGNNTIGLLIGAFVCLFLGLALIGVVADQANKATDLSNTVQTVTLVKGNGAAVNGNNITIDYTITGLAGSNTGVQSFGECSLDTLGTVSNILVFNTTGSEQMDNGVCSSLTNDFYYIEGENTIKLCNSVTMNQSSTVQLRYRNCPNDYVGGWAGNMLVLVPGFFALALLGCSIALFYSVAKLNGIL
jgi:hypothetical protein